MPKESKEPRFLNDWPKIKKQLTELSQEAVVLAKKGEKELARVTKQGKIKLDEAALSLKREQYYYLIGKEYCKAGYPSKPTAVMQDYLDKIADLEKGKKALEKRYKATTSK